METYIISDPGITADRTINPGQWVRARGSYTNQAGLIALTTDVAYIKANVDGNLVPGNIKDGVTIFGVTGNYSGGGSVAKNDIQIDSYSVNAIEPTADVEAPNMATKIKEAVTGNKWFKFRIYIQGTSPLVSKTYKMKFNAN